MSTHSITRVFDYDGKEIVCIYQQYDGYYEGVGKKLACFIATGTMVNGLTMEEGLQFNGPECFAAQLVAFLKGGKAGGTYLYPPGSEDLEEEYEYHILPSPRSGRFEPGEMELFAVEDGARIPWQNIADLMDIKENKIKILRG